MAYEIVSTPDRLIAGTTVTSRWVATDCPVIFGVQRNDGVILQVNKVGDAVQIVVNQALPNFALQLGEEILLLTVQAVSNALQDNFTYARVTSVGSPGYYMTDAPWIEDVYDSNRVVAYTRNINYSLDCRLAINGKNTFFTTTPSPKGFAEVQVNRYLWEQVNDNKLGAYWDEAVAETNQCGQFELAIREVYTGIAASYVAVPNTYYFAKASREKDESANLSEFVPNYTIPSKFLNLFGEPSLVRGLPFDVSFLYPVELGDLVSVVETQLNASGASVGTKTTALDATKHKGKLVSYWVDASVLPATCVSVRVELQGDDTPPVVVDTWYISTAPFSVAKPLKLVKNFTTNQVHVTGEYVGFGAAPLPAVALSPAGGLAGLYSSTSLLAPSPSGDWGKYDLTELHMKPTSALLAADVQDGFVQVYILTGHGQFAKATVNYTRTEVLLEGGLIDVFRRAFSDAVGTINTDAHNTDMRVTRGVSARPGFEGVPALVVDTRLSPLGPNGVYPFAFMLIHTLGLYPFNEMFVDLIAGTPTWALAQTPVGQLYLGNINSTKVTGYNLDKFGLTVASKIIDNTYTAV